MTLTFELDPDSVKMNHRIPTVLVKVILFKAAAGNTNAGSISLPGPLRWPVKPKPVSRFVVFLLACSAGYVPIYQLSYMWYGPFAVFVTTITGLLVSFLTGITYNQLYFLARHPSAGRLITPTIR